MDDRRVRRSMAALEDLTDTLGEIGPTLDPGSALVVTHVVELLRQRHATLAKVWARRHGDTQRGVAAAEDRLWFGGRQ